MQLQNKLSMVQAENQKLKLNMENQTKIDFELNEIKSKVSFKKIK